MTSDDPNHRPTLPLAPPSAADATRTFAVDPSSTVPFLSNFTPITGPVDTWPAGLTRYQPLHLLGDGGMGEVYLAHDTQLDRQVAIKFARRTKADTAARVLAEARAAARLHHPGICPVFDADVSDGVPYLTMAFVQGPNLAAELKRLGPCPPAYAAKLVRAVAEAMQYAHDHGVIHRDLKPGNILLTADHDPVVTDFGLAVRIDREELAQGVISGTPHYMAPEQAAGATVSIGERTDVFALGVILFEMLCGRTPFDGNAREVLEQVKAKPVPPVRKVRKDVPAALAKIVARATAHNPADRFDGMSAFADALTHYLRVAETPKRKTPGWVVAVMAGLAAALVLPLLLCGLGLLLPAMQKASNRPNPAIGPTESERRAQELTHEGELLEQAGRPDMARTRYSEALFLDPNAVATRQLRARLNERQQLYADALRDMDVLVEHDANNVQYRRDRAVVHIKFGPYRIGSYREAVIDLDEAMRLGDESSCTFALRAEALFGLKEYDKALTDLNQAIELDSKNVRAFRLRAAVKERLNDQPGSEADALRARKLGDTSPAIPPPDPAPPPSSPGK